MQKYNFETHDPFYSEQNQAELLSRIRDIENGVNLVQREIINDTSRDDITTSTQSGSAPEGR